jgi:dolichol-phosphate mannosyltransferase
VAEIPVAHRPRRRGRSKYGLGRTFKVPLDLMTVKFLADYSMKPLYVFGGAGLALCAAGAAAAGFTLWEKIARGVWVHRNPLLLVAVFLFILGAQLFLMGLLAELVIRVGHRARGAPAAPVREETP